MEPDPWNIMEPIGRFLIFLANEHLKKSWDHMRNVESIGRVWKLQDVLPKKSSDCNSILTPQDSHQKMNDYISLIISKIKVFEFLFYHFTSQQLHLYRFWCHSTVAASKRAGSRSWKGNCPKSAKYKTTSDTLPTPEGPNPGEITYRIHRCQWCQRSRFKIVGWSEIPR